MLKRVLVPLDPSPYTDAVLEWACRAARRHSAELTGMVVLDIPGIRDSIGPVPLGGFHYAERLEKAREKKARDRIESLLAKFKEKCRKEGVAHRVTEHQGTPSEQIIKESIYYDAVMMGMRTCYKFGEDEGGCDSLEEILDHSITPVYGIPEKPALPELEKEKMKVLIAFDGSHPAARALQRFAQLAVPSVMEVTLVKSDDDAKTAQFQLDQAEAFLRIHGLTLVHKECITQHIIDAMDQKYLDWAHLVVVGAHSKKGLFDFMLGSLSRFLVKEARKPVLIAQ
jgi:nucleotide-binding universal stress UspA family protein